MRKIYVLVGMATSVAQWLEHLTGVQEIHGSNPGSDKNFSLNICHLYVGQCQVIYFHFSLNHMCFCFRNSQSKILIGRLTGWQIEKGPMNDVQKRGEG